MSSVLSTPIQLFVGILLTQRATLWLECQGLRYSRGFVYATIKRSDGFKEQNSTF